jgi:hypothetical protein
VAWVVAEGVAEEVAEEVGAEGGYPVSRGQEWGLRVPLAAPPRAVAAVHQRGLSVSVLGWGVASVGCLAVRSQVVALVVGCLVAAMGAAELLGEVALVEHEH